MHIANATEPPGVGPCMLAACLAVEDPAVPCLPVMVGKNDKWAPVWPALTDGPPGKPVQVTLIDGDVRSYPTLVVQTPWGYLPSRLWWYRICQFPPAGPRLPPVGHVKESATPAKAVHAPPRGVRPQCVPP